MKTGVPSTLAASRRTPQPRSCHVRVRIWSAFLFLAWTALKYFSVASAQTADPLPQVAAAGSKQALFLRNGDRVTGTLESIDPKSSVRWRRVDVEEPIEFKPEHVAAIEFSSRLKPSTNSGDRCLIRLANNDELEGSLVQLDETNAVFRTWYAGELNLPRRALQGIIPIPPDAEVVFRGPASLDGWTIGKVVVPGGNPGEWKFKNGAFYATNAASIARDVKLPDTSLIEFDLAWKGLFQLAVALYTDYFQPINLANKDTEPNFGGFYSLQINSFSANLLPVKKNEPLRFLGQVSVPSFNQKNAAHIEIRSSKSKRTVALLVDGDLIKQWTETEEFAGQGRGVRFVHQGQGKVRLSQLRVSQWDGQFIEKAGATNAADKVDLAKLRNGDRAAGEVKTIKDGQVSMSTPASALQIPLARVKQIEFARQKRSSSMDHPTIRAYFTRGCTVTFELGKWEDGKIIGSSPNLGNVVFDASAFERVELNLGSR